MLVVCLMRNGFIEIRLTTRLGVNEMPIVQVSVWEGMSAENKKKTVEGITKVFVDMGMPPDAVNIVIYEAPKTNWATGGQLHSERHANR
jgi:4-oxalocrotonate tautomerase